MLWVLSVRVDLDEWTPQSKVEAVGHELGLLLNLLEPQQLGYVNLAISGAALRVLRRAGRQDLIERIRKLAADLSISFVGTAENGAVLPLLPPGEIERQLALSAQECERVFPESYTPHTLWPPKLAHSRKVSEVALRMGFSEILVDELALGEPAGSFDGTYIPTPKGLPGVFLLPTSRVLAASLAADAFRSLDSLRIFEHPELGLRPRFLVAALELGEAPLPLLSLRNILHLTRSARTIDLHLHFDRSPGIVPTPCSALSSRQQMEEGAPFATWFAPDNRLHALQWRALALGRGIYEGLIERGYAAVPGVFALRENLDLLSRELWWRAAASQQSQPSPEIGERARLLWASVAPIDALISEANLEEIRVLCEDIASPETWEQRFIEEEPEAEWRAEGLSPATGRGPRRPTFVPEGAEPPLGL